MCKGFPTVFDITNILAHDQIIEFLNNVDMLFLRQEKDL